MSKAIERIESRLERLEKELAQIKAALPGKPALPWYRQIVGDFAGTMPMSRSSVSAGLSGLESSKNNGRPFLDTDLRSLVAGAACVRQFSRSPGPAGTDDMATTMIRTPDGGHLWFQSRVRRE
jgi:hypothetical protein